MTFYLLPWETRPKLEIDVQEAGTVSYVRKMLGKTYEQDTYCEGRVYFSNIAKGWVHKYWITADPTFKTHEKAKQDLDEWFVKKGFILLNDWDRVGKLLLLI